MSREFGVAAGAASSPAYGPREASKASAARRTIFLEIVRLLTAVGCVVAYSGLALAWALLACGKLK